MAFENDEKSILRKPLGRMHRIYHRAPACLRRFLWPIKSIRGLFEVLRVNVWIIERYKLGKRPESAMLYVGHELQKNFWASLAMTSGDFCRERYIGKTWLWRIHNAIRETSHCCSLVVAEVPHSFRIMSQRFKSVFVPSWVSGEVDISSGYASLFKGRNTSLKSDLSRIRRNKLNYVITHETSDLEKFYYDMYLPYITKIHGNRALLLNYDYLRREFKQHGQSSELLFVNKGGERIAGVLLVYRKNKATLWALGIKDGDQKYVEMGAVGALYHFAIRHAANRGFAQVVLGGSRPLLQDGVLRYKKKFNQRLFKRRTAGFLVRVLSDPGEAKAFLLDNPFICEDREGLKGAVFVGADQSLSAADVVKIHRDYYLNGLSKLVIYRFGQTESRMHYDIPAELSEKIEVRSAEDIF